MINTRVRRGPVDSGNGGRVRLGQDRSVPRLVDVPEPYRSRPFRYGDAVRAGLSDKLLRGPRFWAPFPGVRVPCTLPDTLEVRCRAAGLILPEHAAFSHRTAALLCELPVPAAGHGTGALEIIVPPGAVVPRIVGIVGHTGLILDDVAEVREVQVVRPERTFFHLAPSLPLDNLVVLGDAIVRSWCSVEQLIGRASGLTRHRGIVRARSALQLIKLGVDSPMETRLRLMIIRAGLPCPTVNADVFDQFGGWIARPDLAYPHLKIAIEYDGDHHRTDKQQWRRDRARDENLRHLGWVVITLTAADVLEHQDRTIARIARYYRARTEALRAAA
jgi:hypothetical protein